MLKQIAFSLTLFLFYRNTFLFCMHSPRQHPIPMAFDNTFGQMIDEGWQHTMRCELKNMRNLAKAVTIIHTTWFQKPIPALAYQEYMEHARKYFNHLLDSKKFHKKDLTLALKEAAKYGNSRLVKLLLLGGAYADSLMIQKALDEFIKRTSIRNKSYMLALYDIYKADYLKTFELLAASARICVHTKYCLRMLPMPINAVDFLHKAVDLMVPEFVSFFLKQGANPHESCSCHWHTPILRLSCMRTHPCKNKMDKQRVESINELFLRYNEFNALNELFGSHRLLHSDIFDMLKQYMYYCNMQEKCEATS